jgi:hypothetical protein
MLQRFRRFVPLVVASACLVTLGPEAAFSKGGHHGGHHRGHSHHARHAHHHAHAHHSRHGHAHRHHARAHHRHRGHVARGHHARRHGYAHQHHGWGHAYFRGRHARHFVRASYARHLRGRWRVGAYHWGRAWHHQWAYVNGWTGYRWYTTRHWGNTRWVNGGGGTWDFASANWGSGPTYVWPERYYLYAEPSAYYYYCQWPVVYYLFGGPALTYRYPALAEAIVVPWPTASGPAVKYSVATPEFRTRGG